MKRKMTILLEITTVINITKIATPIITTDREITTDIEATVENIHKIIIDLILDKDVTIDLQIQTHLDPDMTTIIKKELHPELHIDHHTEKTPIVDIIHDQDKDLVLDQDITDHDLEHPYKTHNKTE